MTVKTTFRKLPVAWPLVLFLVVPSLTRAETAVQAWVQRYNGPANSTDVAWAVAVDGSNNVIVTGYSFDSGSRPNYATIKYSSTGVPLWTNRYHGLTSSGATPTALVVDGSNDVVVTGYSHNGANQDYVTIKYSSAGLPFWTNQFDASASGGDWARAVAVDDNNDVIVTGWSSASGGYFDYATIKYSSAGVPLWTNRYNGYTGPGNSDDYAYAVAVDSSNNVIVTGYSTRSSSAQDYASVKYSSAGVPLWTNRYNGPGNGNDLAYSVAVDGSNNVVVTGWSAGSGSASDYATIKYSGAGVPLWTNRCNGPGNGDDIASTAAVDRNGDVVVTGYSLGSGSAYDYATIKYSSEGVALWTNRYNGPGNGWDSANAVALDGSNNVIVTGRSDRVGMSDRDYATIKYSSTGVPLWTNRYRGAGFGGPDEAYALALDRSGNVIVTGYSAGSGIDVDFATVKYLCIPEPMLTALPPTNGTFQMRVDDVLQPGTLVIEASTRLSTSPPDWLPVFTNTTPTNVLCYTDPEAATNPTRFYRAFQSP